MVCHLQSTNLCFDESEKNRRCSYPENNCSKCVENASFVGDVCQCDSGYSGLGYIYCNKDNEPLKNSTLEECKVVNELTKKDYFYCCDIEGITCEEDHITEISLKNVNLRGSIPESIGNLEKLKKLDLSENKLNGTIPETIENLTELNYLNISGNDPSDDTTTTTTENNTATSETTTTNEATATTNKPDTTTINDSTLNDNNNAATSSYSKYLSFYFIFAIYLMYYIFY
ncbi:hypothetical protein PIROE2DRAFT_14652 [Piromyces sp. E2]|nr:hypothetical protein PIROE2DRAFT_14652 [Piromyces sp. E2]|eukprot:OUM59749.1 hypothetical protein PIROE2DRAFT_14652 [Piromyces sp. E2]